MKASILLPLVFSAGLAQAQTLAPGALPRPDGPGMEPARLTPVAAGLFRPDLPTRPFTTYITGDLPGMDVIFKVTFDPTVPFSGVATIAVVEPRAIPVDGIDFLPGIPDGVVVGSPFGKISAYDAGTGAVLPDLVVDTDLVVPPPLSPGTSPSSILSTATHAYYVENQFGFGATLSHRIMRVPFGPGPTELVYDGTPFGILNFEGLEIVGGRLYFFAKEPGVPDKRALFSIGLAGGVWDGVPEALEIPGLFEALGPGTDGSDELDYDPASGLLFGTNIVNGELIAFDVAGGFEVSSPGAVHFVDGSQVAASSGGLSLLGGLIDGIRSTGGGQMVFCGKAGVLAAIDIGGVLSDGADDGDVIPLIVDPAFDFDDLTPLF